MLRKLLILFVLSACHMALFPQSDTHNDIPDTAGIEVLRDLPVTEYDRPSVKSPTVALALSAVLPGAGQIYNGSYWKTPIILAFASYFTYAVIILHDEYNEYRERYKNSITPDFPAGSPTLRYIRDFYRDRRDGFIWYLGIVYLVNLLDAYVEANLSGFEIGENLSFRLFPFISSEGGVGLQCRIRF